MTSGMKILVTGAKGFVGKNLCVQLNNIKDGKARCYGDIAVDSVYEYDLDSTPEELDVWCAVADFVFNLAGENRPQNQEEFMQGNFGFASILPEESSFFTSVGHPLILAGYSCTGLCG